MRKTTVFLSMLLVFFNFLTSSLGNAKSLENLESEAVDLVYSVTKDILRVLEETHSFLGEDDIEKIIDDYVWPNVDFEKTVQLVMGQYWKHANRKQIESITNAFRKILTNLYKKILTRIAGNTVDIRVFCLRNHVSKENIIIRSLFYQLKGKSPMHIDYRIEKAGHTWKIYDMNIEGIWLINIYRNQFSYKINQVGIDGLIKSLWKNCH